MEKEEKAVELTAVIKYNNPHLSGGKKATAFANMEQSCKRARAD